MGNLHLSDVKIWKFSTLDTQHTCKPKPSCLTLNNKSTICYHPDALACIGDDIHHDRRYNILPFGCIKTIWNLRLNVKPSSWKGK